MATKDTTGSTKKGASAKDLLSSLTAGKKATPKKADAKVSRPEMELPPSLEQTFKRFIGAHALSEVVEARRDQEKEALDAGCFEVWTERLWKTKARPANPTLKVDKDGQKVDKDGQTDMSAIFQVQERYVMNLPAVPEGKDASEVATALFVDLFQATGMDEGEAKKAATDLVNNELDFTPKTSIDFNRLVNGHYEGDGKNRTWVEATAAEQELAAKVIQFLTDEEAAQLIEVKYSAVVKPKFLERVCGYVHSLDQLRAIFTVVKPVKYPSHIKFAASDTPEEKNRRLLAEAVDILGIRK